VFSRRKTDATPATAPTDVTSTTGSGKGRPTPRRKQVEAANKRPLVPAGRTGNSKSVRAAERAAAKVRREQEYQAMVTGDDRHLPVRDRGPVRRFVRDYVDARRTMLEYMLPGVLGFLVVQILAQQVSSYAYLAVLIAFYLFVIATVVDVVLMWRRLRKRLIAKFGPATSMQGLMLYTVSRASQIRRTRMPRPQVKRGEHPS
jgi:hypothetical protein